MSKTTQNTKLTAKQEKFCQEYVKTGSKSEAYRLAYNAKKMKPETINVKAVQLFKTDKIRIRVQELQNEIAERNKVTIDECVSYLANLMRFDIAEFYDENGSLKPIHQIPKQARAAIAEISVFEEFEGKGEQRELIGYTKKIKTADRRAAIVELMKHLGGYEKHNRQKQATIDYSKLSPKVLMEIWNARSTD